MILLQGRLEDRAVNLYSKRQLALEHTALVLRLGTPRGENRTEHTKTTTLYNLTHKTVYFISIDCQN